MGRLQDDLLEPGVERVETHISWVFLHEREVFKIKKPAFFGFLDFRTLEQRREACEAEVRLNRRLAPGVYRGVVPITRDGAGRHCVGGAGVVVDWGVHMERLPDGERADHRLAAASLGIAEVEAVARVVAVFHEAARCDQETTRFGSPEAIEVNVRENFEQTRRAVRECLSADESAEVEGWQTAFLDRHRPLFEARMAARRVRDGHGDLRLEHVYLSPEKGVRILDGIEFNERFRFADVAADVAFLSMDLAWHGRVDLAERFLAAYAREADDYDLYPLIDFYESYRAFVRGKVATLLAADETASATARQRAGREARRYFLLALASERRSLLPPTVVAVGGVIATGKSTVAERIAQELAAPIVDADRTRKHLLGVSPEAPVHVPAFAGPYSVDVSERVYAELLRRAEKVLESGRPVVLDASFRAARHRRGARHLAQRLEVPFTFVECRAPARLCRRRLEEREGRRGVSDGRLEIFDDFVASWEAVSELPDSEHVVVDTTRPLADNVAQLEGRLPIWPAGLTS